MGACCSKNMQVDDGSDNKSQYRRANTYSHPKTEKNTLLAQSSAAEIFERAEADSILPATEDVRAALLKETTVASPNTGTTCECDETSSQTQISSESNYGMNEQNGCELNRDFEESASCTGRVSFEENVGKCLKMSSKNLKNEEGIVENIVENKESEDEDTVTTYVYGLLTNRRTNQSTPAKIPIRQSMTSRSTNFGQTQTQQMTHRSGEESSKSNVSRSTLLPICESDIATYTNTENNSYINLGNISPNATPSHYMPQNMFMTARSHYGNTTKREYNFGNTQTNTGPQHFRIGTVDSQSQSDASEWHRITSQDSSEWDFEFWENFDASAFEVCENQRQKSKSHTLNIPVLNMELVAALRASENGFSPIAANVNSFKPISGLISARTTFRDGHSSIYTPAQPVHSHTHTYMPVTNNGHTGMVTQRSVFFNGEDTCRYTDRQKTHTPIHKTTKQVAFVHSNTMPNLISSPKHTDTHTHTHTYPLSHRPTSYHTNDHISNTQGCVTARVNVPVSSHTHTDTDALVVEKICKLAATRTHTHTHNLLTPMSQQEIFGKHTHTHTHTRGLNGILTARETRTHTRDVIHTLAHTTRETNSDAHTHTQDTLCVQNNHTHTRDVSPQPPVADERVSGLTHTHTDIHSDIHSDMHSDAHTHTHNSLTHRPDLLTETNTHTTLAARALSTHRRGEDPHYKQMYTKNQHSHTHTHTHTDHTCNGDSLSSQGSLAWTSLHTASMGRSGSQDAGMSFCSTQSSCVAPEEDLKSKDIHTHTHTQSHTLNGLITSRRQPNILMDTVEEEDLVNTSINAPITTR